MKKRKNKELIDSSMFRDWHIKTKETKLIKIFRSKMRKIITLEMPGIEPGAFHMQSERATTALHPHTKLNPSFGFEITNTIVYKTNWQI